MISKRGLVDLIEGKAKDVQSDALNWYHTAKAAGWDNFGQVRRQFPDADLVDGLLVFNIRSNRFRLIVFPVFSRRRLYIKALLTHKEYMREEWKKQWP